ncbi:ribosomal protein L31 (chloroplast) [Nannochloropsis oceanica]|uniref:Large ribosomal subunit protein bL31c n=1 Tax=Nannochloropsis oceanica TaxID=145522 RepID=T1RH71_9STRA|nr:ribosomal protein L31 [Nannochloropsis oceanica]AGI98870.1 ribosomal protein L31 [Nannochloropsis oceanica]AGI99369.1 ribosomal protein L31 [Nannochloropsis oceanica]AHX25280.1 50S ribosomal protein L31 [Nannochloropsis oceanica]
MPKKNIHPSWFEKTKVYCDGKEIMTISSTKPELHVDIWSGNHPFFTGSQKIIDTEGRVERFLKKYNMESEESNK